VGNINGLDPVLNVPEYGVSFTSSMLMFDVDISPPIDKVSDC